MDAAQLTQLFTAGALIYLGARFMLHSLDRAEAGFASLFVPPDRTLPWPRGVQESDSPWGWRSPSLADDPPAGDVGATSVDLAAIVAGAGPTVAAGHLRYVEPPHKVDPIHVRTLPQ